ncbi:MAG: hypothetical protein J3R72DRAFT_247971 [Linnemannia gamsii]|nr:MAG: hypothetical protein J3R72DRAFT_247971 [Linnemannia gamsii]
MSTPLLIKVQQILKSTELFSNYIVALKLDNPSASHTQVMQSLQTFLSYLPENMRLEILKVFAEQEASDSMGFSTSTLDKALQVIHADTQLYIDILSTLQLNQTENMPWDAVVNKVKTLVLANKPQAWAGVDQFLKSLHWGHQEESSISQQLDVENDDDEIVEMVEGVDYYPDEEDEDELESFPEGEEFDHHYAAFLQDVQEIHAGRHQHQVMGDFVSSSGSFSWPTFLFSTPSTKQSLSFTMDKAEQKHLKTTYNPAKKKIASTQQKRTSSKHLSGSIAAPNLQKPHTS